MEKINPFDDLLDENIKSPEGLKDMLVSEINVIRDALSVVNMFFGEPMLTCVKCLQELEPKKEN